MRWHFNLFNIDSGRKATPLQWKLYVFVNTTIPAFLFLAIPLSILIGIAYVAIHFLLKYW